MNVTLTLHVTIPLISPRRQCIRRPDTVPIDAIVEEALEDETAHHEEPSSQGQHVRRQGTRVELCEKTECVVKGPFPTYLDDPIPEGV